MSLRMRQESDSTPELSSGEHYLTADVANVWGVTPAAVRAAAAKGTIRAAHITPGGCRIFHAAEVMRVQALRLKLLSMRHAIYSSMRGETE